MEALKADYFKALCLIVCFEPCCQEFGVSELGLTPAPCSTIRWYLDGHGYRQEMLRKPLMKEVLEARDQR